MLGIHTTAFSFSCTSNSCSSGILYHWWNSNLTLLYFAVTAKPFLTYLDHPNLSNSKPSWIYVVKSLQSPYSMQAIQRLWSHTISTNEASFGFIELPINNPSLQLYFQVKCQLWPEEHVYACLGISRRQRVTRDISLHIRVDVSFHAFSGVQ